MVVTTTPPAITLYWNSSSSTMFQFGIFFFFCQIRLRFSWMVVMVTPMTTILIGWVYGDGFYFSFFICDSGVCLWWFCVVHESFGFTDLCGLGTHDGIANTENHNLNHCPIVVANLDNTNLNILFVVEGLTLVQTIIVKSLQIQTTMIEALVSWW